MSPHQPGVRPFATQVVQSPWNAVIDAPSLHREVKDRIRKLVSDCGQPHAIRCLTVAAPPGYGKTHLLAWTRQLLDKHNDAVFVYVSPFTPGGPSTVTFEQHVMRATLDALWSRSRRQQSCFEQSVRTFLVGCYDRIIDRGSPREIKGTLRIGSFLKPTVPSVPTTDRPARHAGSTRGAAASPGSPGLRGAGLRRVQSGTAG